jgi:hypothetical protein
MVVMDEMTNAQGQVLLKWVLPRPPKIVQIAGTDRTYTFSYNFNVCASWVNPEDVSRMLLIKEKTCNCAGGTYKQAFMYCNQLDHNLWLFGNREGKVFTKEM